MAGINNASIISHTFRTPNNVFANNKAGNNSVSESKNDIRRLLTNLKNEEKGIIDDGYVGSAKSNSANSYSESLRVQRQQAKNTSLKLKKLKYQFKDISSQIVRSKTSSTARQVASKAKREVIRLRREKQSGNYDSEEIELALSHAKAMERIARKKVKHLEEEEMAKASGGLCAGNMVDNEEALNEENQDEYKNLEPSEYSEFDYDKYINNSEFMESLNTLMSEMSDFTTEMSEEMNDLLEEMGYGELSEATIGASTDMDPEDIKAMKIKHRNKEMKEIVQADAEYLKALFKYYDKMKASGIIPGMSSMGGENQVAMVTQPMPIAAMNVDAMPSIDVVL